MADEQSRKGAAVNHKDARHNYDTAKAMVRRATRGKKIFHERIRRVYAMKGEKLDRREESKLSWKEQTTRDCLRSGQHLKLKYWLYKIVRAVDSICRKCGIGEDTAEHVV